MVILYYDVLLVIIIEYSQFFHSQTAKNRKCKGIVGGKMKKSLVIAIPIVIMFMAISLAIIYMPKATATTANAKYVSDKKCYFCHKKQAKDHIKSAHAKSFDSLMESGQEDNAKCLLKTIRPAMS